MTRFVFLGLLLLLFAVPVMQTAKMPEFSYDNSGISMFEEDH